MFRRIIRLNRLWKTPTSKSFSAVHQHLRPSYFFKPGDIILSHATLGELVNKAADEVGDLTAFLSYHQGIQKTYSEFKNEVDKLASGFLSLGLRRGDRVGLCAPNIYEWPLMQFATAKVGLIMVNVNPAYRTDELEYCLKKVGCRAFVTSETFKTQKYYDMLCSFIPELERCQPGGLQSARLPDLQSVILISEKRKSGTLTFDELLNAGDNESDKLLASLETVVQFDDPVNIQFTSGTTGSPKAAVLTHHNIVNNAFLTGRRLGYHEERPIVCCQVPLYHCFGCVLGSLGSVLFQHTCVFPSPSFNAEGSLKAIHDEKCTAIYGTPTMFVDILSKYRPEEYDISSLKQAVVGGAPCPESVLRELNKRLDIPSIHIAYGLTETSPAVSVNGLNEDLKIILSRCISPLEFIEFKVTDSHGNVVPMGSEGELCVRGHVTFMGYWKQEDKTAEVVDEAKWFHTGDLVKMHESGHIQVIGRLKDMIIRGGENIYPQEVENFLHKHPDILEVHICGVPDERMGEELCAWVKMRNDKKLTEEEIKNYCKGKISHFKIPRYIMFVDDFPKTVSGKIQKFRMKEVSVEKLCL